MVFSYDRAVIFTQPVDALLDDTVVLTELLNTYQVAVITITIDANGNIKVDLILGFVRLLLT